MISVQRQANMVDSASPSPEHITLQEFRDALARYDQLIEAVSASKAGKNNSSALLGSDSTPTADADNSAAKPGHKTLQELDQYRYVEAPALFAPTSSRRAMQLGDVQTLVEWKLCVLPA